MLKQQPQSYDNVLTKAENDHRIQKLHQSRDSPSFRCICVGTHFDIVCGEAALDEEEVEYKFMQVFK